MDAGAERSCSVDPAFPHRPEQVKTSSSSTQLRERPHPSPDLSQSAVASRRAGSAGALHSLRTDADPLLGSPRSSAPFESTHRP
jgi:hypothetical protein